MGGVSFFVVVVAALISPRRHDQQSSKLKADRTMAEQKPVRNASKPLRHVASAFHHYLGPRCIDFAGKVLRRNFRFVVNSGPLP